MADTGEKLKRKEPVNPLAARRAIEMLSDQLVAQKRKARVLKRFRRNKQKLVAASMDEWNRRKK